MPPTQLFGPSAPDLRRVSGPASNGSAASIGAAILPLAFASLISLGAMRQAPSPATQPDHPNAAATATTQPAESDQQPDASVPPPAADASVRFLAFDLFINPNGRPLAAYQIEITAGDGPITTLVGVEGGDGHYAATPYYDPAALHEGDPGQGARSDRVILAAIADLGDDHTGAAATAPPTTDSRIARLHYMVEGDPAPALSARLIVAGADEHTPIDAVIRLVPVVIEDP